MKVVMAWSHGADVPALRAAYPGIEIVEVERASLVDVIGDADVVYGGGLTGAELRAALSALGGAEPSLGDGNGTALRGDEAALLRRELKKAAAREATLSARLVAAKAELAQLRERLLLPPAVDEASPEG